jgi:chromosomal replication initiation ATPase DnaA
MKPATAWWLAVEASRAHLVPAQDLFSNKRGAALTVARAHAYRLAKDRYGCSENEIAKAFNKDRSTVQAALRRSSAA